MRKTIRIGDLVDTVNLMLENSTCDPEVRRGMCSVVETVLHKTDNYDGFRYLNHLEVPEGCAPGKLVSGRDEDGNPIFDFPDDTRRQYGCKHVRKELTRPRKEI